MKNLEFFLKKNIVFFKHFKIFIYLFIFFFFLPVDQNFHQLAAQGEQALVAEKLEMGTDIDEIDSGHTALSWACQHNQADMVRFLLERGADASKASVDGETPLAFASSIGNLEIAQMLLSKKAPVNVYDYVSII